MVGTTHARLDKGRLKTLQELGADETTHEEPLLTFGIRADDIHKLLEMHPRTTNR